MELKSVLKQCGIQNQPTLILAADGAAGQQHQVVYSTMAYSNSGIPCVLSDPYQNISHAIFPFRCDLPRDNAIEF